MVGLLRRAEADEGQPLGVVSAWRPVVDVLAARDCRPWQTRLADGSAPLARWMELLTELGATILPIQTRKDSTPWPAFPADRHALRASLLPEPSKPSRNTNVK